MIAAMKRLMGLAKRWRTLPANQRGVAIVSIPIVCLLSSVAVLAWLDHSIAEHDRRVQHTQSVRLETQALLKNLVDAETGVRGFGLTRRPEFLQPYSIAVVEIPRSLNDLEQLVQDNPQQLQRLAAIKALIAENMRLLEEKLLLKRQVQFGSEQFTGEQFTGEQFTGEQFTGEQSQADLSIADLYTWLQEGKETMDKTRSEINAFALVEEQLLRDRQQRVERYRWINALMLLLSVLIGVTSGGFAIHLFLQLNRELVDRETQLQAANVELERACDRLERFTANASHELRAPIAAMLSNAQVGLMAADDDLVQPRQRLGKIVQLAKAMSTLVNDLLFLARHGGIADQRSLQLFDMRSLLNQQVEDWQAQTHAKLQIIRDLPNHPVILRGDADLIQQVVANLLSNACRYTPAGGSVAVRLQTTEEAAIVEVSDTGIGISPEALPYIFERFYREDRARFAETGGFGLGLAIAQQIVHTHQGKISVASEVGVGSTFTVSLPRASVEDLAYSVAHSNLVQVNRHHYK
jgi:signal transduction histidine kinase